MKEVEILIDVLSTRDEALKVLGQLDDSGAKRILDVYFYDPLRPDLKARAGGRLLKSFRVRKKNNKCFLTYKIDNFDKDDNWIYSDEHEMGIDDFDTALLILQHLGLKELVRVDNEKHIFTTPEYELVLEDVKDLGLFLEVECLADIPDNQVTRAKTKIRSFINQLGIPVGKELNAGKPELMLKLNE
ncbi:MAG: class IV adenylate cyclase [Candidatus Parcubacteria bacterium]|nr:class IV adenylate cyclase [Candidatus Parcubacteria bacterium]